MIQVKPQISLTQESIKITEEDKLYASLDHLGLPPKLYELCLPFCESWIRNLGRGSFSITCNAVEYDPLFVIFGEFIEMPYVHGNLRCEASVVLTDEKYH
jgi:hypothetical protein